MANTLRRSTIQHLRHLYSTRNNQVVNFLTQDLNQITFDEYATYMQNDTSPSSMLIVATLADYLKTPIEILRPAPGTTYASLASFSTYVPSGCFEPPFRKPLRNTIQLLLDKEHFLTLITTTSYLWPMCNQEARIHPIYQPPPGQITPISKSINHRAHLEAMTQHHINSLIQPSYIVTPSVPKTHSLRPHDPDAPSESFLNSIDSWLSYRGVGPNTIPPPAIGANTQYPHLPYRNHLRYVQVSPEESSRTHLHPKHRQRNPSNKKIPLDQLQSLLHPSMEQQHLHPRTST